MPLGVTLADLRYELRAELYTSLLPAHGLSSVDLQNMLLARTQRELWRGYEWTHLKYAIDFTLPQGVGFMAYDSNMPFENVRSIWCNQSTSPDSSQNWYELGFGFDDNINVLLQSYPPTRWRNVVKVVGGQTQYDGQIQFWPVPTQDTAMRFWGMAPLNPLKVDSDKCMIDSTAIVMTCATEILASQKAEAAQLKGQKTQAYIRALLARTGANKRQMRGLGQGELPGTKGTLTPYIDYIPGP